MGIGGIAKEKGWRMEVRDKAGAWASAVSFLPPIVSMFG